MYECVICQGHLLAFSDFNRLKNVTSDSKPTENFTNLSICLSCGHVQKPLTPEFKNQAEKIYSEYQMFSLANGVEQVIFTDEGQKMRSHLLVNWLKSKLELGKGKAILDYGCGECSALVSLAEVFKEADLFGYEIKDLPRPKVKNIKSFREMFVGHELKTDVKFDLITMIHCLEHIQNPSNIIKNLWGYLNEGGYLFIQVPDLSNSDYDILVADHVSHFFQDILSEFITRIGFDVIEVTTGHVKKEITLLAKKSNDKRNTFSLLPSRVEEIKQHVQGLIIRHSETVRKCRLIAENTEKLAIFGSSISAMWLWGELDEAVKIFVDEDPNKLRKHDSYEILSPKHVAEGFTVLVPLIPEMANKIFKKYNCESVRYLVV